jgi:hypothetical protein
MNAYERSVRQFKTELVLQTVFDFEGRFGAAAQSLGVHRNLVTRVLGGAGYNAARVKRMVRRHKDVEAARPGGRAANLGRRSAA